MNRPPYFFDLPVSDISGSVCNALRMMCHGCLGGVFGQSMHERVDLTKIKAIKIRVSHKSTKPLSDQYEYHLVFYRKCIAASIWDPACRKRQADLRALTRRVSLNAEKSLLSRRLLDNLFIRSERPIYFTKYEEIVPPDHYVPLAYHQQLFREFEPYLMRTAPGYPLVRTLVQAQGLDLAERKLVGHPDDLDGQVVTYTLVAPALATSNRPGYGGQAAAPQDGTLV